MEVEFSADTAFFGSLGPSDPTDVDPVGSAACGLPSPAFSVFLTPLFAAAAVITAPVEETTYPVVDPPPGLHMALFLDTETKISGHERIRHTRWIVRSLASKSLYSLHPEVFCLCFFFSFFCSWTSVAVLCRTWCVGGWAVELGFPAQSLSGKSQRGELEEGRP